MRNSQSKQGKTKHPETKSKNPHDNFGKLFTERIISYKNIKIGPWCTSVGILPFLIVDNPVENSL